MRGRSSGFLDPNEFFQGERLRPVFVQIYKGQIRKVAKTKKGCQTLIQVAVKDRYQLHVSTAHAGGT